MVYAVADNLRVQTGASWFANGYAFDKVYDVVWSDVDAKKLAVDPPKDVAQTIQERAWCSPIWSRRIRACSKSWPRRYADGGDRFHLPARACACRAGEPIR